MGIKMPIQLLVDCLTRRHSRNNPVTDTRHLKEGVNILEPKQIKKYKSSNRLTRPAKSFARLPDFVHLTCHMLDQIKQSVDATSQIYMDPPCQIYGYIMDPPCQKLCQVA